MSVNYDNYVVSHCGFNTDAKPGWPESKQENMNVSSLDFFVMTVTGV